MVISKWVVKLLNLACKDEKGAEYRFQLFTRDKDGEMRPTQDSVDQITMSEEEFHRFTSDLNADVYFEDHAIMINGNAAAYGEGAFTPDMIHWLEQVNRNGGGTFLGCIRQAAFHAEGENAVMLTPVIRKLMEKNPKPQTRIW